MRCTSIGFWSLVVLLAVLWGGTAQGGLVFTVRSPSDAPSDGVTIGCIPGSGLLCTLRAAVQAANATTEEDEIELGALVHDLSMTGEEDLAAAGDLDVQWPLKITGRGASTVIDGKTLHRVFDVRNAAVLTLSQLTIRNGKVDNAHLDGCAGGGAVCVGADATVNIVGSVISGNTARQGAGIFVGGTLTLEGTTLSANTAEAFGGGLLVSAGGSATLTNCPVTGNTGSFGGGIAVNGTGATLNLQKSTLSGGKAVQGGGLALLEGGKATIANVTVSGNAASQEGGGIFCDAIAGDGACFAANNVTIANNTAQGASAGGGVFVQSSAVAPVVTNSILADNTPTDCDGTLGAGVPNLVETVGTCPEPPASPAPMSGWLVKEDPLLVALAANNGATQTHALGDKSAAAGDESPALGAGNVATCEKQDQRSEPRGQRGEDTCDLGAFELANDADKDGISDAKDLCPALSTPDNADADGDGVGDACECAKPDVKSKFGTHGDDDDDGIQNHQDCCAGTVITNDSVPLCEGQPSLVSTNGCSIEQECACDFRRVESRADADEVPWRNHGAWRKCVKKVARGLKKVGVAQTCRVAVLDATFAAYADRQCGKRKKSTADRDGDGVPNSSDNCPQAFNPLQTNSDDATEGNRVRGNACDEDNDDDNLLDDDDKCPNDISCKNEDADSDGFGNECDECPWKNTFKRIDGVGCSKNQEHFGPVPSPDTCEEAPADPDPGDNTE